LLLLFGASDPVDRDTSGWSVVEGEVIARLELLAAELSVPVGLPRPDGILPLVVLLLFGLLVLD
jgi:hypothetical protein